MSLARRALLVHCLIAILISPASLNTMRWAVAAMPSNSDSAPEDPESNHEAKLTLTLSGRRHFLVPQPRYRVALLPIRGTDRPGAASHRADSTHSSATLNFPLRC